jgi:murein DD-endopeptidase MepM/ murein hydrolase activator NlpD
VLAVILGAWWVGARVIAELWSPRDSVAAPRTEPAATAAPGRPAADPAQHAGLPSSSAPPARSPELVAPGAAASRTGPGDAPAPTGTTGEAAVNAVGDGVSQDDVDTLRARRLRIPVEGVGAARLTSNYHQARGARTHEAMDIMAPRGTPVLAVEDGRVAKLFTSKRGGLTIYQFDPSGSYCYYYAHLDRYSHTLDEGAMVSAGDVIGFVGSTGNASPDAPHLHFAVFKLGPERQWWQGLPIDPYLVLR